MYSLNDRDMANDKSILVPLKGLCIGGGYINMSGTTDGYVCRLARSTYYFYDNIDPKIVNRNL